jgi:tol-pal system protein YbgF
MAVLASGCASRRAVDRLESDIGRLRSELAELRVAQEATSRDLANANSQLQALDVKSLGDEVARLNRRADAVDSTLADTRTKVEALATAPAVAMAPAVASVPSSARSPVPSPLPPPADAASPVPAPTPPTPAVMTPVPAPMPPEPAVMTPVPAPPASRPATASAPASVAAVEKPRTSTPPAPSVVPAKPGPKAAGNPEQEYAAALATYRAREHGQAVIDFMDFIAKYPKHPLAGNAQYWIGEAYWAQRDYRQALVEFEKVFEHGPAKAPDALLKIGLCHLRLNDVARAQQAWQRVVDEYPKSESAAMARSLIATHSAARR